MRQSRLWRTLSESLFPVGDIYEETALKKAWLLLSFFNRTLATIRASPVEQSGVDQRQLLAEMSRLTEGPFPPFRSMEISVQQSLSHQAGVLLRSCQRVLSGFPSDPGKQRAELFENPGFALGVRSNSQGLSEVFLEGASVIPGQVVGFFPGRVYPESSHPMFEKQLSDNASRLATIAQTHHVTPD